MNALVQMGMIFQECLLFYQECLLHCQRYQSFFGRCVYFVPEVSHWFTRGFYYFTRVIYCFTRDICNWLVSIIVIGVSIIELGDVDQLSRGVYHWTKGVCYFSQTSPAGVSLLRGRQLRWSQLLQHSPPPYSQALKDRQPFTYLQKNIVIILLAIIEWNKIKIYNISWEGAEVQLVIVRRVSCWTSFLD